MDCFFRTIRSICDMIFIWHPYSYIFRNIRRVILPATGGNLCFSPVEETHQETVTFVWLASLNMLLAYSEQEDFRFKVGMSMREALFCIYIYSKMQGSTKDYPYLHSHRGRSLLPGKPSWVIFFVSSSYDQDLTSDLH